MSESREFCPRCGAAIAEEGALTPPTADAPRQVGLCRDCYFAEFGLVSVPAELTVRICASCGAVKRDNEWLDVEEEDATDIAIQVVGDVIQVHRDAEEVSWMVEPVQRGPNELDLRCAVSARVHGELVEEEHVVSARIAKETCERCGRIAGDYYAGSVQVRAAGGRTPTGPEIERAVEIAHEVVDEMAATGDRWAFVSEVLERPEGVDIRVSTNQIGAKVANRITDELGGGFESSERLITENADGERVYRVSFSVRLPRYRAGDIIDLSDGTGPILVRSEAGAVRGRSLATGEEVVVSAEDLDDADRVGTVDDAEETTVVAVEDEYAVQVLDPQTFAATTIPRPTDFPNHPETVHVIKARSGVYVVPRSAIETEATR